MWLPEVVVRPLIHHDIQLILKFMHKIPMHKVYFLLKQEYCQHLRPAISINSLPGPPGRYDAMLQFYCDDKVTPQQLHDLGIQETKAIIAQINEVG